MSTRTVLVPLDGTASATVALPIASALAALEEAALKLIHVAVHPPTLAEMMRQTGVDPHLLGSTICEAMTGPPARSILRAAAEPGTSLIVLSTHVAAAARGEIGHTALEVLRKASCPVVLVPPGFDFQSWRLHEILIPVDGTPTTAAALRPASELARCADATLFILHVAVPDGATAEPGSIRAPCYVDQPQHEWPAWRRELVERTTCLSHMSPQLQRHACIGIGDPGTEIVRFAVEHEVDLIVLAWRARLDRHRAQAARTIISGTPCPLLIFRIGD